MTPETTASKLLAHLGVYSMMLGSKIVYRGATPARKVMGRNGTKRAGAYGKGLRNWINSKNRTRA
jgi:hypothetical protein